MMKWEYLAFDLAHIYGVAMLGRGTFVSCVDIRSGADKNCTTRTTPPHTMVSPSQKSRAGVPETPTSPRRPSVAKLAIAMVVGLQPYGGMKRTAPDSGQQEMAPRNLGGVCCIRTAWLPRRPAGEDFKFSRSLCRTWFRWMMAIEFFVERLFVRPAGNWLCVTAQLYWIAK
jgi:hypothetical protein